MRRAAGGGHHRVGRTRPVGTGVGQSRLPRAAGGDPRQGGGDTAGARALHERLLPLMLANFAESNPIPVKASLAMMGLIEERYRLPMVPPRADTRARLAGVLTALGLLEPHVEVGPTVER